MEEIMMKELERLQKINNELETSKLGNAHESIRGNILVMCEIAKILKDISLIPSLWGK